MPQGGTMDAFIFCLILMGSCMLPLILVTGGIKLRGKHKQQVSQIEAPRQHLLPGYDERTWREGAVVGEINYFRPGLRPSLAADKNWVEGTIITEEWEEETRTDGKMAPHVAQPPIIPSPAQLPRWGRGREPSYYSSPEGQFMPYAARPGLARHSIARDFGLTTLDCSVPSAVVPRWRDPLTGAEYTCLNPDIG